MTKIEYYASAMILGTTLFIVLLANKPNAINEKSVVALAPKVEGELTSLASDEIIEGYTAFEKYKNNHEANILNPISYSCNTCKNKEGEKTQLLMGDHVFNIVFVGGAHDGKLYAKGIFYVYKEDGSAYYVFISEKLKAAEAYYRKEEINFSGAFENLEDFKTVRNWEIPSNVDLRETWEMRKDEEHGLFYDLGKDMIYTLDTED